ncbi:carbon-nitrogen hydrolase family protein [Parapedobacter lycopersici]|uniref:carbon-nitrogen hydrolase family protein n=1 Tax=Parapedobacter lycopersici TaxID=1864939 RepID=UPI00214D65AF|nr:carbon-nitrogen hydrolase family protein [Parapedobacter lycopersici]
MKIALATPPLPTSLAHGLLLLDQLVSDAALQRAEMVCFPESFLPGYIGMGYPPEDRTEQALRDALARAADIARKHRIAVILPMDGFIGGQIHNLVYVLSAEGEVLGYQTKNQLDPSEDGFWTAGEKRQLFEINGLKFGITICHEGFRYPESVRWCAYNGAHLVFHPHFAGSNDHGQACKTFGAFENPYYEKAMMMRALENTIYFASVNYASKYQESASAVIAPDGSCIGYQPYGEPGVLVVDIDPEKASGRLAKRFKPQLLQY